MHSFQYTACVADTKTLTQHDAEQVQTTIRMPVSLNTRAKIAIAPFQGMSINQLCIEGLEIRVKQLEEATQ